MTTRAIILVVALSLLALSSTAGAQDCFHSSWTQSYRESISLQDETEVVVHSSLRGAVHLERGNDRQVILDVTGAYTSDGTCGIRGMRAKHPTGRELAFEVSRSGGVLTLVSPEWSSVHHWLEINRLTVTAPEGIPVRLH